MINEFTRLDAACRRFKFEMIKSLGIFWLIEKIPGLKIKEPWNKLYKRTLT
jgi:hypothetical protein